MVGIVYCMLTVCVFSRTLCLFLWPVKNHKIENSVWSVFNHVSLYAFNNVGVYIKFFLKMWARKRIHFQAVLQTCASELMCSAVHERLYDSANGGKMFPIPYV
jgi:hypothetical protein